MDFYSVHFRFKVEYQAKFIERSQNIEVREAALRGTYKRKWAGEILVLITLASSQGLEQACLSMQSC